MAFAETKHTPAQRPDGARPMHYEYSYTRAHCGVRLSLKTLATRNPAGVNCPKCWPAALKDLQALDRAVKATGGAK
jgi:hypothetical protein